MGARIIVGSAKQNILKQLSHFLMESGYNVIGETTDGYDFLRKVHSMYPDLCILDFNMKGLNGHEISEVLISDNLCPVITMVTSSEEHYFMNLSQEANFTLLIKPLNRTVLLSTIDIMIKTSKSIKNLQKEVKHLKKRQESKTILDQAKEQLMKRFYLTEDKAHKRILKESMNRGISKEMVANEMIEKYREKKENSET